VLLCCRQPCFAVFESGGTQWKVTADDVIFHNKIPGVEVNDVLQFNKVLLLGTQDDTTIGRPFVPGATVVAAVEENFRDAKVCALTPCNAAAAVART
jgi:large subunit ribosomal protein L21